MCHKSVLLETPRVLRGFDVKGEDIVISRTNGEKELWILSQGKARRLCRGFSPLFAATISKILVRARSTQAHARTSTLARHLPTIFLSEFKVSVAHLVPSILGATNLGG